jgi:hypothetical protein
MSRSKRGIPCQKIQGMLSEYIDGKLNKADKGIVEAHLEVCDTCSRELESLRATIQLLHRVPEVSIPRTFTVVAPRREHAYGATSLRWLRPATAVASIALVFLLVGDFVHVFENDAGVGSGGEATSTYTESVNPTVAAEKQIMVTVPGVMGQMSLATARSAGYKKYDVLPSTPVAESAAQLLLSPEGQLVSITADQPVPSIVESADSSQDMAPSQLGEAGVGWPLRQIEIALGAVIFISLVFMIVLRRRRGRMLA